jgi:hypothetical protein
MIRELDGFQGSCRNWVVACMGEAAAQNKVERNFRFVEEAVELVQSCGCSKDDVLKIVDYVFSRPIGEPAQEVGGTMTTLASLCNAHGIDLEHAAVEELRRCWTRVDEIRAKALAKRTHAALPGVPT